MPGLRLALLSVFIDDLDEDIDGLVIKCVGDTKLEEVADTLGSRTAKQKRLDSLKWWARPNQVMLNGDKRQVLPLGEINKPIKWNKQQRATLHSGLCESARDVSADYKLRVNHGELRL